MKWRRRRASFVGTKFGGGGKRGRAKIPYASQAMRALLQYAFGDMQLHIVYATAHEENADSMRFLERTWFTRITHTENKWRYEFPREKYLQFRATTQIF